MNLKIPPFNQPRSRTHHRRVSVVIRFHLCGIALVLCLTPILAQDAREISSFTIDGGGGESRGQDFSLSGTIGQPDAGSTAGERFSIQSGYWPATLVETVTQTPTFTPTPTSTEEPTPTPTQTSTFVPMMADSGYYILDSMGGRSPVGNPPSIMGPVFFGFDIARDLEKVSCTISGSTDDDLVVLDGYGATHFVKNPSCNIMQDFFFMDEMDRFPQGRAVDLEMSADGRGFWVLTDYGAIYRAGSVKRATETSLIEATNLPNVFGFDIPIDPSLRSPEMPSPGGASLRAVAFVVIDIESDNRPEGFVILDSQGGRRHLNAEGIEIPPGTYSKEDDPVPLRLLDSSNYFWPLFSGLDIARDMELHPSQNGLVILDGWDGIHPVPVDDETNPVYFANNRVSNDDPSPRSIVGMPYVTKGFDDPSTDIDEGDPSLIGFDAASIFKDLEFSSANDGFYVLDGFGGVFAFGSARQSDSLVVPAIQGGPYTFPYPWMEDMEVFENRENPIPDDR